MKFGKCSVGLIGICLLAAIALSHEPAAAASATQNPAQNDAIKRNYEKLRATDSEYARVMDLYNRNRHFEARPLLESLVERYPSDPIAMERLGICLVMTSVSPKEAADRKQQRARARKLLLRAKELGIEDNLIEYYVSAIPEDGGADAVFSNHKEANDFMKEGEAAFARGSYQEAIAAYTRAMEADPTLYSAVLFIGDSYFASGQNETAAEWFERATRVDPNRESGYRYWGDALMRMGKMEDARSRFIDAIIAEPYNRGAWAGISQWIGRNKLRAAIPDIKRPKRPEVSSTPSGGAQITFDPSSLNTQPRKDGTGAWNKYQLTTGAWQAKLFKERFPNEKVYRHTLMEEKESLGLVAAEVTAEIGKGALKPEDLDPGIATLLRLHTAGLLEPHILFNLADNGIAQDYRSYREANRDKLLKYLDEFVVPKAGTK